MKFKLLIWLIGLLLTVWICSCSTRKTDLSIERNKSKQESELKIDLKEAIIDKSINEKLTSDNGYTIVIKEYFGQLTDNSHLSVNQPIFRETTFTKSDKKTSEKEFKNLTSNKAVQAKQNEKQVNVSKIKKKPVEVKGFGFGKVIGVTLIVVAGLIALYVIWKQKKAKSLIPLEVFQSQ